MRRSVKLGAYFVIVAVAFTIGVAGTYLIGRHDGFNIGNMSLLNSMYFTLVTMSTVGYGDIYPVTNIAKIFVMALIIMGLGIVFSFITIISGDIVNERLESLSSRLSRADAARQRRHVVLIGTSGVNMLLAKQLKEKKEKFMIISQDKEVSEQLNAKGYRSYFADPTSESEIGSLNLKKAKQIVLDLGKRSETIYALLIVRGAAMDVNKTIIVQDQETERHIKELGLSDNEHVVNPNMLAANSIIKHVYLEGINII